MISRTIEAVEVSDKTLIYEIRIEDIEFHILGQTVKTNKWLRFEEWQQIYEQLNKSFSTYSTTPPDFTIKSFTVGNYIRVEVELFPIENCYGDLFNVKLENCMPDFLQIRIKQIALGLSFDEIQKTERKQEEIAAAIAKRDKRETKRQKKKRRSASLSEYNPVRKNQKTKYVPPYKASKLSPDVNETDEPYSPKPVAIGEVDGVDDYSPFTISSSENNASTPIIVPTYKPSAIVRKELKQLSQDDFLRDKAGPNDGSNDLGSAVVSVKSSQSPTTSQSASSHNRHKSNVSPTLFCAKRLKLSEDLFADSEDDESNESVTKPHMDASMPSTRTSARRKVPKDSDSTKKSDATSDPTSSKWKAKCEDKPSEMEGVASALIPERRSSRTPAKKVFTNSEMHIPRLSRDSVKSSTSSSSLQLKRPKTKSGKDARTKESLQPKSKVSSSQDTGSSSKQHVPLQSIEELQYDREMYEKEFEKMQKMSKNIKDMIKPPANISIVDLNNIKKEDLIASFVEFKPKLDKLFERYKNERRFPHKHEAEKLLILNIIDRDRAMSLMDHLQSVYEPIYEGVPSFTDLFMNIIVPEWVLRIFMKKVNLSRDEAIARIKQQRDIDAYNQSFSSGGP